MPRKVEKLMRRIEKGEREKFESNKISLNERYQKLPELFKIRLDKLRDKIPDFWKHEDYEISCCETAILIVNKICEHLKSEELERGSSLEEVDKIIYHLASAAIHKYKGMSAKEQEDMVPGIDHSNLSPCQYTFSILLAKVYVSKNPEAVTELCGAIEGFLGPRGNGQIKALRK